MAYPGTCRCTWLVDGGDLGKDTVGTYQPINTSYPIASIGAIEYRLVGNQYVWTLKLTRFYYSWNWTSADARYYGKGWGWAPTWEDHDCQGGYGNPYWGGYGGYGWNGWGWGYGYGSLGSYGYYYGQNNSVSAASYSLQSGSVMSCSGAVTRFYLDNQLDNPDFRATHWPAYVDISRVQN